MKHAFKTAAIVLGSMYIGGRIAGLAAGLTVYNHENEYEFMSKFGFRNSCRYDRLYDALLERGEQFVKLLNKH